MSLLGASFPGLGVFLWECKARHLFWACRARQLFWERRLVGASILFWLRGCMGASIASFPRLLSTVLAS